MNTLDRKIFRLRRAKLVKELEFGVKRFNTYVKNKNIVRVFNEEGD